MFVNSSFQFPLIKQCTADIIFSPKNPNADRAGLKSKQFPFKKAKIITSDNTNEKCCFTGSQEWRHCRVFIRWIIVRSKLSGVSCKRVKRQQILLNKRSQALTNQELSFERPRVKILSSFKSL